MTHLQNQDPSQQQPNPPVNVALYHPAPAPNSGLAVASMVLGIVGLVSVFCTFGVPALLAVILGHVALTDIKKTGRSGRGMAVTGLTTGYIALTPALFFLASAITGTSTTP